MAHAITVLTCQYKSTVFMYLVSLLQQKPVSGIQGLIYYLSLLLVIFPLSPFQFSRYSTSCFDASGSLLCDMLLCLLPQVSGPAECLFLCTCKAYLFTHPGLHQESSNLINSLYFMQLWLVKLPTGLLVANSN